jgi:sugar/nucleoside kinase (ribokinase family)
VREEDVQDTSGAGDGFEGALLASLDLWGTSRPWEEHIGFASTVGSMMVQQFGNKHFPTRENVESLMRCAPVAVAQAVA